jgi:hypothetical protein
MLDLKGIEGEITEALGGQICSDGRVHLGNLRGADTNHEEASAPWCPHSSRRSGSPADVRAGLDSRP